MAGVIYFPTMPKREYRKRFSKAIIYGGMMAGEVFLKRQLQKYLRGVIYGSYGFPTILRLGKRIRRVDSNA